MRCAALVMGMRACCLLRQYARRRPARLAHAAWHSRPCSASETSPGRHAASSGRAAPMQTRGRPAAQGGEKTAEEEVGEERYPSVVPFLPPLTDATIREYFRFYVASVGTLVLFGGLLAPMLEVRLGLGGARRAHRARAQSAGWGVLRTAGRRGGGSASCKCSAAPGSCEALSVASSHAQSCIDGKVDAACLEAGRKRACVHPLAAPAQARPQQTRRGARAPSAARARAGTSYGEFIRSVHLPQQLAQVDPIVASFCGGAVGVLSTLMVVEARPRRPPPPCLSWVTAARITRRQLCSCRRARRKRAEHAARAAGKQCKGAGGTAVCLLRGARPSRAMLT